MKTLLHPSYLPNITTFAVLVQQPVIWEVHDNYQKQTYRNRSYICNDRGRHLLNIPILHVGSSKGRQKYKEVRLGNEYLWQRQHWRTLQTAYRSSPYFEFYEDEISVLYEKKYSFLMDYNLKGIEVLCNCLQLPMPQERTTDFKPTHALVNEGRFLVNAKQAPKNLQEPYTQVFNGRHPFIENLSVLDLIFNEGPNAVQYLQNVKLEIPNTN